jgi:hypothetical protein
VPARLGGEASWVLEVPEAGPRSMSVSFLLRWNTRVPLYPLELLIEFRNPGLASGDRKSFGRTLVFALILALSFFDHAYRRCTVSSYFRGSLVRCKVRFFIHRVEKAGHFRCEGGDGVWLERYYYVRAFRGGSYWDVFASYYLSSRFSSHRGVSCKA